jgi:transcriptional regulator with XRE-family HTH domain
MEAHHRTADDFDGSWVRALREQLGWSQSELATRAGVSYTTVSDIERGQRPQVTARVRMRITQALESPADGTDFGIDASIVADALTTLAAVLERTQADLRGLETRVAALETQGAAQAAGSEGADLSREAAVLELQDVAERLKASRLTANRD